MYSVLPTVFCVSYHLSYDIWFLCVFPCLLCVLPCLCHSMHSAEPSTLCESVCQSLCPLVSHTLAVKSQFTVKAIAGHACFSNTIHVFVIPCILCVPFVLLAFSLCFMCHIICNLCALPFVLCVSYWFSGCLVCVIFVMCLSYGNFLSSVCLLCVPVCLTICHNLPSFKFQCLSYEIVSVLFG